MTWLHATDCKNVLENMAKEGDKWRLSDYLKHAAGCTYKEYMLCLMDRKLVFILVPTAKVKKKYSCTSANPTCHHGMLSNNSAVTLYYDVATGRSEPQRVEISSYIWTQ
jgi:hypothetical protein